VTYHKLYKVKEGYYKNCELKAVNININYNIYHGFKLNRFFIDV